MRTNHDAVSMRGHSSGALAVLAWVALILFARLAGAASEMAIVPYDPKVPVAKQQPDRLYLPYERFLELWEQAKTHRAGTKAAPADQAWVLTASRYEGRIGERALTFRGTLDLLTTNDAWVKVPLNFDGTQVSGLRLDGQPAIFDGAAVMIEKPGRHRLEVTFEIPRRGAETEWQWHIPRTAATLVALALPDARLGAKIVPGSGVIEHVANGVKTVTAALGATDTVQVALETTAPVERVTAPATASIASEVLVANGAETTRAEVAFTFPKARQDRFTVYFENGLTLIALEAENVKSWKLAPDGARQALEVVLHEPVSESFTLAVTCERGLPALPGELRTPVFSASAGRVENRMALFAGERIALTPQPGADARQIVWEGHRPGEAKLVGAYAGSAGYRAAVAEPLREARVDYVYQVNRRKIELIASLQLFAKGETVFGVTLGLPAQFEVQAVESPRLQDWWREGGELRVRFQGATPDTTPLVVYLVRQYPAAPTELDVRPLTLTGFKRVSGEAVIAAHKGVEAAMTLSAEARELAPDKAATDFQILPPLERKRGFAFKEQNFSAQVKLAALPAKFNALWVLHAQAHEGWIALSTRARLSLRQGSLDRAAFTLPAALPEVRVSGDEVRETRSRIEGDRRIYEVQFQNDVYEQVDLTLDVEVPNPTETALPAIAFPEAVLTSGYVLADNASEFEMRLKPAGVDPAPTAEIPWLPALSKAASIWRVQPGWSVTMAVDRLEKVSGRAAFCAWAEFTTALRRDGTAWHKASWRLQNRSLQFLPVRLPAGAELMSARVAGQSVRADQGVVDGVSVVLIPLIKTKPGDLSYDVEVVWRARGGELGWRAHRDFADPELPGITVERTFWNVWLPEDRTLSDFDGNMESVVEQVQKVEKLEGAVQELKQLVATCVSPLSSVETRRSAYRSAEQLSQQIEAQAKDQALRKERSLSAKTDPNFKGKALESQQRYIAQKSDANFQAWQVQAQQLDAFAKQEPAVVSQTAPADVPQAVEFEGFINYGNSIQSPATNEPGQSIVNGTAFGRQQQNTHWDNNRAYLGNKTAPALGQTQSQSGTDVLINDNIVLNRVQEPVFSKKSAKDELGDISKSVDESERMPVSKLKPERNAGPTFGGRAKTKADQPAAKELTKMESRGRVAFNTARGNALDAKVFSEQKAEITATPSKPSAPAQAPAPAAAGIPGAIASNRLANPATSTNAVDALLFSANRANGRAGESVAGVPTDPRFKVALQQRLQPEGRISLAVDFPTEGKVWHFKKVKAHAQLALTVTAPESLLRWKWLAAGLAAAGALALLGRIVEHQRARWHTAPAHA